jgi:tyrosyl-DNA phosphodiesterase-1
MLAQMVDSDWLLDQYPRQLQGQPLTIVMGSLEGCLSGALHLLLSHIHMVHIPTPPYGTHHTKMMLLFYKDGLKVVIHTANLIPRDWGLKTQGTGSGTRGQMWCVVCCRPRSRHGASAVAGVWESPLLPRLASAPTCDAFGQDLLAYLAAYTHPRVKELAEKVAAFDFSAVQVPCWSRGAPARYGSLPCRCGAP